MFAPHDSTSNLRSNSNPFRTVKCITSNPTKEQNKEILCSYDFPNQTSWPVRSCCTIPIWQMTLDFSWILGFTSVKEPFSLFSTFFSSFYCVDFFISFVLRHLWVKQFFALRMSWSFRTVRVTFKFIILEKMRFINLELRERITKQRLKWVPATIRERTRIEVQLNGN